MRNEVVAVFHDAGSAKAAGEAATAAFVELPESARSGSIYR